MSTHISIAKIQVTITKKTTHCLLVNTFPKTRKSVSTTTKTNPYIPSTLGKILLWTIFTLRRIIAIPEKYEEN
ncbi:MAG: hypothetical protein QXO71_01775 [Candidatus Jordarchaeaceae archaeon]